jgi:hypothetical protein
MRVLFAAAVAIAAASPAAAIINAPVAANAYVTFGGLDWAWASPCDASGPNSCGPIDLSFQSTQGWRVAVAADFASGMNYTKFQFAGANVPANGSDPVSGATFFGGNSVATACATPWFSNSYSHCDFSDGVSDIVWNMPGTQGQGACCHETWVVRDPAGGAVPEPASWAMLIAGFGLVGAIQRRRKAAFAA